ncbi:hypothetical protein [Vibrio caribbeanicus]|uniref:Uncharacterized protein n=1 Tax=Vibrio caribbeanicus ATCC BAA-2122 TaxID=796620 RepID=E3BLI9_9VIBR|nr:hypothetical protein [Vibrio caribbeanicus]EFP96071.1 hypothetical protein VIBC2010_14349 [Vibrio caribbeanicus ATCC BAA-2122]
MKKVTTLAALVFANSTFAMNVNTMLLVSDEYGNGVFTVSNEKTIPEFIQTKIIQLKVQDNELVKTPYTEDNFDDWKVTLTHPKMIVEPGREKNVGVRSLCGTKCDFSNDQYFFVSFEPSNYDPEGKIKSEVSNNFGYRPIFVIPANKQKIDFSVIVKDDELVMENKGNTFIKAHIDQCNDKVNSECQLTALSLAGRKQGYKLPKNIDTKNLMVEVVNHDRSYSEKVHLDEGKIMR